MSSARGLANHHLYLARLVLAAWRDEDQAGQVPAPVLAGAFGPGVRDHLQRAYGWFLLAIAAPDEQPPVPPARLAELPPCAEGRARAGELREFEQLEAAGWLADLLAWQPPALGRRERSPGNLARPAAVRGGGSEDFGAWAEALERCFQRMGDSLNEY
ncbi:MAG: hypothetical protein ACK5HY_08805 [Parahaliea sp.]